MIKIIDCDSDSALNTYVFSQIYVIIFQCCMFRCIIKQCDNIVCECCTRPRLERYECTADGAVEGRYSWRSKFPCRRSMDLNGNSAPTNCNCQPINQAICRGLGFYRSGWPPGALRPGLPSPPSIKPRPPMPSLQSPDDDDGGLVSHRWNARSLSTIKERFH